MRKRYRHASALIAVALAGGPVACSGDSSSSDRPAKVAFVVANSKLNFALEMGSGFSSGVKQVGDVESVVVGPDIVDGPRQVEMFQEALKTYQGGISVFTLSPDLFAQPLADAARGGIPLIAVDNPPPPSSNVSLFVGNDNVELGRLLATEVAGKLPANSTGTIVLGTTSPGVPVLDQRVAGIREELAKRLPNATILGPFDTKQEVAANLAAWQVLVDANPEAIAFIGTGDADGWHLGDIRKSTGGTWQAGAFDLDPRALQSVKDGNLVLVSPEHFIKGAVAGRLQAQHVKNDRALPKGWIYTPGLVVNQANVDAITARQASDAARESWFNPIVDKILDGATDNARPIEDAG